MKKLLLFVFILISCKDDNLQPQKFTSIVGHWTYSENIISGNFEISGTNGAYTASGTFKINGGSYFSTETTLTQNSLDPVILSILQFKSATGEYIRFENIEIDLSDYRTIYANYFEVHTSTEHFQYPSSTVKISRK